MRNPDDDDFRWFEGTALDDGHDLRTPDQGDGLWLTYRNVETLPGQLYQLEYLSPWKFVSIEPEKTGYAKFSLLPQQFAAGKVELQAHLILDRKEVARSSPVLVPVEE